MQVAYAAGVFALAVACGGAGPPGATAPAPRCADVPCLTTEVAWSHQGGTVAGGAESTLAGCGRYAVHARDVRDAESRCEASLAACASPGWADVRAAVAHPDVVAALGKQDVVYGFDLRRIDGFSLLIRIGGGSFVVGEPCAKDRDPECNPIPPGVAELARLLVAIDTAERKGGACVPR